MATSVATKEALVVKELLGQCGRQKKAIPSEAVC